VAFASATTSVADATVAFASATISVADTTMTFPSATSAVADATVAFVNAILVENATPLKVIIKINGNRYGIIIKAAMAKPGKRPVAVLHLRKLGRIGDFIVKVRTIALDIGNNSGFFPLPEPSLSTVSTDLGKLENAETLAKTRVIGSAAARDVEYDTVLDDIHSLQHYVQSQADNAPDEKTAIAIINASGFSLRLNGIHIKPPLAVKPGKATGEIILRAKSAGKRASYNWQMSTDGMTWTQLPSTLKAKTTVSGLAVDVRTFFRFRAILSSGILNWSASVSIIVQ
ncbi:MAG: hypothetical protein JJE25_12480, partial [Bacteroidia bacterium]|nr:hypothetical protein [Bacteroidia bacterium]